MSEMKEDMIELMDEDKDDEMTIGAKLRLGFIRKVYGIIFFQLLITTGVIYFVMSSPAIMTYMITYYWLSIFTSIITIIFMIMLICCKLSNVVPVNYIILILLTIFEAITVSFTTIYFDPISVLTCAGLTMLIVFGLTMYACFTKTDVTLMGGFLLSCSILLFFLGIIGIFFQSYFYMMFLNCCGVLLGSVYLIYDTQLVVGNKTNLLKLDNYILGALLIYLDIIILFLRILRLLGKKKK